jgi:two-component system, OmpR family, response regulator
VTRVLAIEDTTRPELSVAPMLSSSGLQLDIAHGGREGIAKAMTCDYDMVMLERRLPDIDGFKVLSTLRHAGFNSPVVVIGMDSNVGERVEGLRTGCDDYLSRPFDPDEMIARVEALLRRRPVERDIETVLRTRELSFDLIKRQVTCRNELLSLRPTEMRILEFMMARAGQVLTRTMILEAVWGEHYDPGTNLVDVHIGRLRHKIDTPGAPSLIRTVRGAGYQLR